MVIDIISYTDEQLAVLSLNKLEEVRAAQQKKDKLVAKMNEEIARVKRQLIDQDVFRSTILEKKTNELVLFYEGEIEKVREALLFYLRFGRDEESTGAGGGSAGESTTPYPIDYSLSEDERMIVVRDYYETTYPDPVERFDAFKEDTFAKTYIGELYAPLYHYFEAKANGL